MDAKSEAFRQQAGKGRPKGAVNKHTKLAKHAIAAAADELGGEKRLADWAKESPENEKVFWQSIYTKLVPVQSEVSGPNGGPIKTETRLDATKLSDGALREIAGLNADTDDI